MEMIFLRRVKCFAYDEKHDRCKVLKVIDCQNCKFFKTEEQFKKDAAKGKLRRLIKS